MTLIIVILLIVGYLLIATGHLTGVNKAAIAMFIGTAGWVVYICWGADFVGSLYGQDYAEYLNGAASSSQTVKYFIADRIFLNYVGQAAAIVMFLLTTMSIVEILHNNGCLDFISEWIRTRNSKRLLWTITVATLLLSATLDNLTTATVMLVVMNSIVKNSRQRRFIGSAIVLAAVMGGSFTVIGDPVGLLLWGGGAVSPTNFSSWLIVPAITAWCVPTILINRALPDRLDIEWTTPPYRGDDTRLNRWQRILMLLVGLGGLWFVPTFHNITKLPPFLGALCVLSVLWVVNEAFNRRLMNADQMIQRRVPRVLQYGTIQQMLFVMGIMLAMGVMKETGVLGDIAGWMDNNIHNVWLMGIGSGILSSFVDSFTVAITNISFYPVVENMSLGGSYMESFTINGIYWKIIAFCTAAGGCLLSVGSPAGLALMKMEQMPLGWYVRHITPMIAAGFAAGLAVLFAEYLLM